MKTDGHCEPAWPVGRILSVAILLLMLLYIEKRQQQVLHDKKWQKFLRRAWLFRYIPFTEFVFGAGSLATGLVSENSDFDVLIGVRPGRIFTARFFSTIGFWFFGWRRPRLSHRESACDKVCLNHFVTPAAYRLAPPYTDSWRELYKNLVPVWGDIFKINAFWAANADWMEDSGGSSLRGTPKQSYNIIFKDDLRYNRKPSSFIKLIREKILSGSFGDAVERFLKRLQLAKIHKSLANDPAGYKPRLRYDDAELEFHPDRQKFEAE